MSKNDWTKDLRDHLADYQVSVEEDKLWASIQQSLAQQEKKARIIKIRRWSVAAAACAVLGVCGTYWYLHPTEETVSSQQVAQSSDAQAARQHTAKSLSTSHSSLHVLKEAFLGKYNQIGMEGEVMAMASMDETTAIPTEQKLPDARGEGMQTEQLDTYSEEQQEPVSRVGEKRNKVRRESNDFARNATSDFAQHSASSSHAVGWNMKLYAENGLVIDPSLPKDEAVAGGGQYNSPMMNPMLEYANLQSKVPRKIEEKHHRPVALGLQVGVRVSPRVTLTTGVVYTKTTSDFKSDDYEATQTLHYVGVPLGVNYEVWGTRRLHTYVTVGGEGDVNVANNTERNGEDVDALKDRMQWSSHASVGVQYDIAKEIGLYVEPGMKYYFDNGSEIKNTFKDKKLNFSFQLGLRWNLK